MHCQKHQLRKDYLFCLEDGCHDRLECIQCSVLEQKHKHHRHFIIQQLASNDDYELKKIFGNRLVEMVRQNQDGSSLLQMVDKQINKTLDEREEDIRTIFEKMLSDSRLSIQRWKEQQYYQLQLDSLKDIGTIRSAVNQMLNVVDQQQIARQQQMIKQQVDGYNNLAKMQQQFDQMLEQVRQNDHGMIGSIQQIIEQHKVKQNMMIRQYVNNIDNVRQLQGSQNVVDIKRSDELEDYRNQIQEYQDRNQQYKIVYSFWNYDTSLEYKMRVVDMVHQMDASTRVGELIVQLNNGNQIDEELIKKIVDRSNNMYRIELYVCLDQVDNSIHDQIQQLIRQSTLLRFRLWFSGVLYQSQEGLELIKQYNQVIKQNQYLEWLYYAHDRVNRFVENRNEIEQMVRQVSDM